MILILTPSVRDVTALESARVCRKSDATMESGSTPGAVPARYNNSVVTGVGEACVIVSAGTLGACRVDGDVSAPADMKRIPCVCVGELLHGADLSLGCVRAWVCVWVSGCGWFFTPRCKGSHRPPPTNL